MRKFSSEDNAEKWLCEIARDCSTYYYNVRVGYEDSEDSMKQYRKIQKTGNSIHNYSIDERIVIGKRKAWIGCDLDTYKHSVTPKPSRRREIAFRE